MQGTTMGHHGGHGKHHSKAVEHGHQDHHTIRSGQIHAIADGFTVVHDIAVCQHNALGETGGTGGVLHVAHIIGLHQRSAATHFLMSSTASVYWAVKRAAR